MSRFLLNFEFGPGLPWFCRAQGPPPKRQEERERWFDTFAEIHVIFRGEPLPTRLDAAGMPVDEIFVAQTLSL
jgi:hypothetical protein